MADTWEFYKDKADEHRWRCTASNGNIIGAACEGYSQKSSCTANAERHGYNGNPNGLGAKDTWEFYKDKSDEHRWKRTASNGEQVGRSTEGYSSKANCEANAKRMGWAG